MDALVTEWMHSNEAFKVLARKYGKELQMSDEQRNIDYRATILSVANENPKYGNTNLYQKIKKQSDEKS